MLKHIRFQGALLFILHNLHTSHVQVLHQYESMLNTRLNMYINLIYLYNFYDRIGIYKIIHWNDVLLYVYLKKIFG